MPEVLELHAAYKAADDEAALIRARARAKLGRAIAREREGGTPQEQIARRLSKTREQVRRYEAAWRDWDKDHPGQPLD